MEQAVAAGSTGASAAAAQTATRHAPGDPLANAGAFFGQTTLGATDPFFDAATTTQAYPFHEIDPDVYSQVFEHHVLGAGSGVAATLRVDGGCSALRCDLGAMLNEVLGRQARKAELQFWFTFLDFDSNCILSRAEWELAVSRMRECSANPQQAREYGSYDRWRADKLRERRVAWEPQRSFQAPLTTQQEVGWHTLKPRFPMPSDRAKLSSTDVTRREGRTAASYYGPMAMLGA
ncbi:MAG: flagellar associated protein [Monoraphidium minutum]|nr:MAG: flagellar associated protein [Monoraphidium minutum]